MNYKQKVIFINFTIIHISFYICESKFKFTIAKKNILFGNYIIIYNIICIHYFIQLKHV